ncbi:MAG: DegT/DnrJ/EryC1/StrS family aminotransferase [Hyphomicrobiales bacterium]|nr:DegT/DnrJ/EryC1/StrS family aminotransferase [Hyphomicrobiales bacterium]
MQRENPVPINDLRRLYAAHADVIEQAALDALRSGWWLNGPRGKAFSEAFAGYLGVSDCVLVANGTDALELALRAILGDRDAGRHEIVTVANAGGYTTTAARQVGLVPVYADIEAGSQLLAIDAAVGALTAGTIAVVATHLYGNAVDIPALRQAIDRAGFGNVMVVEDCAQSHGARIGARMTGSMGDVATFSFYPTKNLGAMGDGGALVTGNSGLAASARKLQQYGWSAKYEIAHRGGRNSRMDEVQAAILSAMLPHLDINNAERRRILDRYEAATRTAVRFIDRNEGAVVHLAVALSDDRDGFRASLSQRGVASEIHYPILDTDQPGWVALPRREGPAGIPVSRKNASAIVSLPCFPGMTEAEIDRVVAAISDWEAR